MRWRILALLFFARVGLGFQFQTLASVGDDLITDFGLDYAEIGLLIALFMMPGLVLTFPAGMLGRYLPDRLLSAGGLAALALGGVLSALAPGETMIGVGRVVAGVGFVFATLYFTKMVADWFDGREIATAMSILVMSWPFGIAMGQVGHTWLAATEGWRLPFLVASAYCGVMALAVGAMYRPRPDLAAALPGAKPWLNARDWQLVIIAGAAWGVFNAGYIIYLSFGPKMLESLGYTALAAAGIISIGSWLMIASGAVCGQIVDRFGRRQTVLAVCMTGAVVALMLLRVPGGGIGASLLFGLLGMAPAGVIVALIGQAVPAAKRALGMGVFLTVYYAVQAAAPPVAGWLFDMTGQPDAALVLAAALFAAVVPLALLFRWVQARSAAASARVA